MFTKIYEKTREFIKDNYKGIIILITIFLLFSVELPFSIYTPGGAVNLNERVSIEGAYEPKGSFNMAYVSMVKGSIPFLLVSKIIPDWDIVPKNKITYNDEDMQEMMLRERIYLEESINNATILAYKKANKEINIKKVNNYAGYITSDAKTNLKVGDNIISIDGREIDSLATLREYVNTLDEGVKVSLKIERNEKVRDAYATTFRTEDGLKIGVSIITTYDYEESPKLEFKTKASEMGSSGGLMMSLTIYNKLVSDDIARGKKIVGTGTIDIEGNVGEIGGVKYKLIGAVKNKAEIFICPYENYEEAVKVAKERKFDIKIIKAKTFDEALEKLKEI